MILLTVNDVRKHYGAEAVLAGATLVIRSGEKTSLVGPNGAGKTTLMRILAGQEEADGGNVQWRSGATLGYLQQQPDFEPRWTVWEAANDALNHLRELAASAERLARELAGAPDAEQRRSLAARYDRVQHEVDRHDAYHLDHRVERILEGLGFQRSMFRRPLAQLSGGEQNRLMMARLLLAEPDLMLLDEPSNHLDIRSTEWLEDYLAASRSALLVVSHDRYFLDKVTNRTLELFRGTIDSYAGNYTAYRRQHAERVEVQRRTFAKQQTEIAKLEDFVRRHHHGQKHAQAEDRRKKLERIERVDPPREITPPAMSFPNATRCGDVALRVEGLAKGYEHSLFSSLTLDILRGERWGILGPNGCGKTTLLRCLLGREQPDQGRIVWGAHVNVGYFDQKLADLDDDAPVLEAVRAAQREFPEQERRDLLARFGLAGDIVHQTVASLSGGERNRTALARLAGASANFLVLDEPTNHLDLWSRAALEEALRRFDGTVLLVTHDRYFLNAVADHLLVVESGRFRVVDGNYETYRHLARAGGSTESDTREKQKNNNSTRPDQPREGRRKRKFPYRSVVDIETDIRAHEQRIGELQADLSAPDVVRDGNKIKDLQAALQQQNDELATLYDHWEEAVELN